jgi:hypothetical protein
MNRLTRRIIAACLAGLVVGGLQGVLWTGWGVQVLVTAGVVALVFFLIPYVQEDLTRLQLLVLVAPTAFLVGCSPSGQKPDEGQLWVADATPDSIEVVDVGGCMQLSHGLKNRYEDRARSLGVEPYNEKVRGFRVPLFVHDHPGECVKVIGQIRDEDVEGMQFQMVYPVDSLTSIYRPAD